MPSTPHHIIFLGTSSFAVPALEALAHDPACIIDLVVTQPDKPVGRKQEITPSPVKVAAEALKLKIFQPVNINKELIPALNYQLSILPPSPLIPRAICRRLRGAGNYQFLVVVSYGQILSQEILDLPTIAPINLHASLLPRFRGASPIQHAILAGDKETGVTIQRMVKELDAGPIVSQEKAKITARETFTSLHDKLATMGAELLVHALKTQHEPGPQSQTGIILCKKLGRKDGEVAVDTMTAEEIDRKVRALNPWPGVTLDLSMVKTPYHGVSSLKILETSLEEHPDAIPLLCKDGTILHLVKVQPAGKKMMTGIEWKRGQR